jgi:hypothetical protein
VRAVALVVAWRLVFAVAPVDVGHVRGDTYEFAWRDVGRQRHTTPEQLFQSTLEDVCSQLFQTMPEDVSVQSLES